MLLSVLEGCQEDVQTNRAGTDLCGRADHPARRDLHCRVASQSAVHSSHRPPERASTWPRPTRTPASRPTRRQRRALPRSLRARRRLWTRRSRRRDRRRRRRPSSRPQQPARRQRRASLWRAARRRRGARQSSRRRRRQRALAPAWLRRLRQQPSRPFAQLRLQLVQRQRPRLRVRRPRRRHARRSGMCGRLAAARARDPPSASRPPRRLRGRRAER